MHDIGFFRHYSRHPALLIAHTGRLCDGWRFRLLDGGFGSAMNGFKYHHLFNAVIIWDGALHDWNTLTTTESTLSNDVCTMKLTLMNGRRGVSADADIDLYMVVGTMGATWQILPAGTNHFGKYRPGTLFITILSVSHLFVCSMNMARMPIAFWPAACE